MTSTPWSSSGNRYVYSRYAARCSATTVLPVPGPPCTTSTPACGRADDLVLLGLDRGDDVAELTGAAALERGEQRAVATQSGPAARPGRLHSASRPRRRRRRGAPRRTARPRGPSRVRPCTAKCRRRREPHRLATGGPVERLGHRRPPVDHDRLAVARRRRRDGRCGS